MKIKLCSHCLNGLKSREGNLITRMIHVDESDIEESKCDLCEDAGYNELYEVIRSE